MEEREGKRVNIERTEEALAMGCGVIGTGCPFCMTMITDGVKAKDAAEKVQVKDVAELVLERIETSHYEAPMRSAYVCFLIVVLVLIFGCKNEDATIPVVGNNHPPSTPFIVFPMSGSTNTPTTMTLIWSCSDPDGDLLMYDVYFGVTDPPTTLTATMHRDTIFTTNSLDTSGTYYWRITARDNHGGSTSGSVWNFTTSSTGFGDGLAAFYPFSGNANDASGNGNHATIHGPALTSDRFGNGQAAYNFNGVNNYMEIPFNTSLRLSSHFTLCAWVFPIGFYSGRCQGNSILTKGLTADEPGGYSLGYDENAFDPFGCESFEPDKERIGFAANFTGQVRNGLQDSVFIRVSQWYFVAGTYDGMTMKLFVNGTLGRSMTVSDTLRLNTRSIWIGGTENPTYPYWVNGKIDDIRIYRRTLSDLEIRVLHTQQRP